VHFGVHCLVDAARDSLSITTRPDHAAGERRETPATKVAFHAFFYFRERRYCLKAAPNEEKCAT
jgi:hypothetical protein